MARRAARSASTASSSLVWLLPALLMYSIFVMWPLGQVLVMALERWNGYGPRTFVGLENARTLLADASFHTSLFHTLAWEAGAVLLLPTLGLGLALLIHASQGRAIWLSAIFFPTLLPATVVAAIWTLVYTPLSGLLNTALGTIGLTSLQSDWLGDPHLALPALFAAWVWSVLGVTTLLFWAGLGNIGREYVELALVEGGGPFWRFRHVILPGLRSVGVIAVVIAAALGLQTFDLIFVTTGGGPGNATMLLSVDTYSRAFGGHVGNGAAEAALQALAALLLGAGVWWWGRDHESLDSGEGGSPSPVRGSVPFTVVAAAIVLVLLLPLGWLARAAVEPGRSFALGIGGATLDPRTWDGGNVAMVWDAGMPGALSGSLALALAMVGVTLLLAIPAAYVLALRSRPGLRAAAAILLVIGLVQSGIVTLIPLFYLLHNLSLLDTPWAVLLPEIGRGLPFAILVLWGFLAQLPSEPLEAALVDGASPSQHLLRIVLPMAAPAIWTVAIWSFITSWNEYLLPTVTGSMVTVPTLLATFIGKYDTAFGALAAGSLLAGLPSMLVYLVLRRSAGSGLRGASRSL